MQISIRSLKARWMGMPVQWLSWGSGVHENIAWVC
jgi:hypothetical protein